MVSNPHNEQPLRTVPDCVAQLCSHLVGGNLSLLHIKKYSRGKRRNSLENGVNFRVRNLPIRMFYASCFHFTPLSTCLELAFSVVPPFACSDRCLLALHPDRTNVSAPGRKGVFIFNVQLTYWTIQFFPIFSCLSFGVACTEISSEVF